MFFKFTSKNYGLRKAGPIYIAFACDYQHFDTVHKHTLQPVVTPNIKINLITVSINLTSISISLH